MRLALVLLTCFSLLGCTTALSPDIEAAPLGNFSLTRLQVRVEDPVIGGLSRRAEDEVMTAALSEAMQSRFGRFDGDGIYLLSVELVGYVLAQPGIPVLLAPRSLLGMNVNVYVLDDGDWRRLNEETYKLVTFEDAGGDTVIGSGYTQSAEEQLAEMAENAAIDIEKWMREHPEWFTGRAPEDSPTG